MEINIQPLLLTLHVIYDSGEWYSMCYEDLYRMVKEWVCIDQNIWQKRGAIDLLFCVWDIYSTERVKCLLLHITTRLHRQNVIGDTMSKELQKSTNSRN